MLVQEFVGFWRVIQGQPVADEALKVELLQVLFDHLGATTNVPEGAEAGIDCTYLAGDDPRSVVVELTGEVKRLKTAAVPGHGHY